MLLYSSHTASGATKGLNYAVRYLIPSLFPFMVLSSLMMHSGAYRVIAKLFSPITRYVLRLPSAASAAVLLSMVGGFPIGAKCVSILHDAHRIDDQTANRMMSFCVCSGPAFLITGVGTVMLHNPTAGLILYLSQLIAALTISLATAIFFRKSTTERFSESDSASQPFLDSFILSATDSAYSVIELTALVVVFSVIVELISVCPIPSLNVIAQLFLEVTGACHLIAEGGYPLWMLSFAVGFGGVCVHLQIFRILRSIKINRLKFVLFRLLNAVLSSFVTYLICLFYVPTAQTFAVGEGVNAEPSSLTIVGSAALIILCLVFVLTMKKSSQNPLQRIQ